VARGISEALITTAAGLMIAIPVQMAYNYYVTRVNVLVRTMEAAANLVLQAFADLEANGHGRAAGTHGAWEVADVRSA
jgi:biopolymer transport protein ExbB